MLQYYDKKEWGEMNMENTEKEKIKTYEAYGEINYGDKRISKRLEKTLERLHENPSQTICSASADQCEAKAIYRKSCFALKTAPLYTTVVCVIIKDNNKTNGRAIKC